MANECPYCGAEVVTGEIIENRVNYIVESWDCVLRMWMSLVSYKTLAEAEAMVATLKGKHRIVKYTFTKEVVNGN